MAVKIADTAKNPINQSILYILCNIIIINLTRFKCKPRQTLVVKTGSDGRTAKRSAICVSVTCPRR